MFRIKICGITRVEDARAVGASGADAVGLNFYAHSKRYVDVETARELAGVLPAGVLRVGVFVNASASEIAGIAARVPLDAIQLHGDEPPALLAELARDRAIIRAWRWTADGANQLAEYLAATRAAGRQPDAILVDAAAPGAYGGTGTTLDWSHLAQHRAAFEGLPLILAGGLTPANVAAAIEAVAPDGVDTAGGVESTPGIKDARLVQEFVSSAKRALAAKP